MTKSRNILAPRHDWTPAEDAVLLEHYANTRTQILADRLGLRYVQVARRAHKLCLKKSEAFLAGPQGGRLQAGQVDDAHHHIGRFKRGHQTWNKGVSYQPGGNVASSQFKAGNVSGRAAELVQPVGAFRVNSSGYLDLKISNQPGPQNLRWRGYHRVVWERAHGPVPAGMVVAFKPGRRTTDPELVTLDALELVAQAEMMRRNSYHTNLPPEWAKLVQLRGALTRQINTKAKAAATAEQESSTS
ncbi:MAG: hypothetical protein RJA36_1765 [Pseudomonadota bacterium]|jgi:hypothetical protein